MVGTTTLHPAWKQAIVEFKSAGFKPGDILSHEWLYEQFSLTKPSDTTPYHVAKSVQLKFTRAFEAFSKDLLHGELVALDNVQGRGYRIVPAAEQTRWAFREGMKAIAKEMRRTTDRLVHTDIAALSASEKAENEDAINRITEIQAKVSRTRRLPRP